MSTLDIGSVCLIDPDNKFYSQKANGPCLGIISSINKKKTFFGSNTYNLYIPDTEMTVTDIDESCLKNVLELEAYKKSSDLIVIRNPINLPEFNIHDMAALDGALKYMKGEIKHDADMTAIIKQLEKMKAKLQFYDGMREI